MEAHKEMFVIFGIIFFVGIGCSLATVLAYESSESEWSCEALSSPLDRISEDNIHILDDKIIIYLENTKYIKFADSGSMRPNLEQGHNAIEILPSSPASLKVGDIISYKIGNSSTIHRIISTNTDIDGWYATTKGDNNKYIDSDKIRFENITGVVVVIIY